MVQDPGDDRGRPNLTAKLPAYLLRLGESEGETPDRREGPLGSKTRKVRGLKSNKTRGNRMEQLWGVWRSLSRFLTEPN
jgi:hypothetical protein